MQSKQAQPEFTNKLIHSKSLYLRQHAHNPVMWYPWGAEALELAKESGKPILLSIGYSSCYWCHVMEREVFENTSIAAFMNEHFICIKLDREEHPHIDETYMIARQLITREGGWPNNVFLTPDLQPLFACGTHGAEHSADRPSFIGIMEFVLDQYQNHREPALKQAAEIQRLTAHFLSARKSGGALLSAAELAYHLDEQMLDKHDDVAGGFFRQPKFPQENYIDFLLNFGGKFSYTPSLDAAYFSLMQMAAGGIYDQVGCGFHRYAVDKNWYVPHFEKMLYNQAMCASIYTKAYMLNKNPFFEDIAVGTLEFVSGPMRSELGPFYAAIDAETDGVEGAYYSWQADEIIKLLSEEELKFFQYYYALADIPHFPGHKPPAGQALILRKPLWQAAREDELPYSQLAALSGQIMNKLLAARNQREAPALDTKIITSWNGLMISAYAQAYRAFGVEKFKDIAIQAARFFFMRHQERGNLYHVYYDREAATEATLEDYSFLAAAMLDMHAYCSDKTIDWLAFAKQLLIVAERKFSDDSGMYRLHVDAAISAANHAHDGVLPSPVSRIIYSYIRLCEITGENAHKEKAAEIWQAYQPALEPSQLLEHASLLSSALDMHTLLGEDLAGEIHVLVSSAAESVVRMQAQLGAGQKVEAGMQVDIVVQLSIMDGWSIGPFNQPGQPGKFEIRGKNVASIISMELPPAQKLYVDEDIPALGYKGELELKATVKCSESKSREAIEITMEYVPCYDGQCYPAQKMTYKL